MTPDLQALARELVGLEGWRWVAGMLDADDYRIGAVSLHDGARAALKGALRQPYHYPQTPDLTDPATAGLVLQMVPAMSALAVADRFSGAVYRIAHLLDDGRTSSTGWRPFLGEAAARACIAAGRCA